MHKELFEILARGYVSFEHGRFDIWYIYNRIHSGISIKPKYTTDRIQDLKPYHFFSSNHSKNSNHLKITFSQESTLNPPWKHFSKMVKI